MTKHRKISKFLSYVLRHNPGKIGIQLDEAGWVPVNELVDQSRKHGMRFTKEDIKEVIRQSDKPRFIFSNDDRYIRATYGHSVPAELGYEPTEPPQWLYHGTAERNIESIRQSGIQPQNRQFVHLSVDKQTATQVGQRHGKPVVLTISAKTMYNDGHTFYRSDAGIWLTKQVPPSYISRQTER